MESSENNKVWMSAASYELFSNCVQTLIDYDQYKYSLLNDPTIASDCDTFDKRVEPTSTQDILIALRMHPSSGDHGMSLFDELVYTTFFFLDKDKDKEGGLNQIEPVLRDAKVHLRSISDYTTTSIRKTIINKHQNKTFNKIELSSMP